ncbi:MAG: class I SAM-dependent methyltransferase [Candidatus Natronoplasma sp.]
MEESKKPVMRVPKEEGQRVLERLKEENDLDPSRQIQEENDHLLIPVKEGGTEERSDLEERTSDDDPPFRKIQRRLDLPEKEKEILPNRWEMIGEVLLIKLPEELHGKKEEIGGAYAEVLGAKTVMLQGGIEGRKREPKVEKIYGKETETVHLENGISYKLDTADIMFSSGNIDERIRMAEVVEEGEVIIDMFAGIGYFSLPMAVHGDPDKVYALEINPTAFHYLRDNIKLNGVEKIVEAWHGDNRDFSFKGADRVVMGYLHETWKYLDKAVGFIEDEGTIHYHTTCLDSDFPEGVKEELEDDLDEDFEILTIKKIKSYAPHVFHAVADVRVEKTKF